MTYRLGVLLGDDIGLEVVPEAVRCARAATERLGVDVEWTDLPIGRQAYDRLGKTLPEGTLERLQELDGWILGPIGHQAYPKEPNAINPHPILRKNFDLYANVRPARSFPGIRSVHENVDVVIFRENNEGFQPDRNVVAGCGEFMPTPDVAMSVRVITRSASRRLAVAAFEAAKTRKGHVTAVHKDTVFKLGCGLFAEECRKVASEYPDITYDEVIVDTFAMKLAMQPQQFDVVVTTNLFGDILSDLAAGLVGGLGLAPGLCVGPEHGMAQATHGSAPDIAGRSIANPYAMIASTAMLLGWLGRKHGDQAMQEAGRLMERGLEETIAQSKALTPDLGGSASTSGMGEAVVGFIASAAAA